MAALTQGRTLAEIPVAVAMARKVHTARPDDDLATALAAMTAQQVHRLPVVDARGVCIGVVSSSDLVRHAAAHPHALSPDGVVQALAAIAAPRGQQAAAAPAQPLPPAVGIPAVAAAAAAPPAKAGKAAAGKARTVAKAVKPKGRKA
jgi:CBS domain containing-hemolysin-like protein